MSVRVTLTTANTPGAVAIVQLHGEGVVEVLRQLTGTDRWPSRRALLVNFADIDEGLATLVSDTAAQLMPHGGPRVVQRLLDHLAIKLGCAYDPALDPQAIYPEAKSPIEADMLDAIAKAASPAALDLLSQQPRLWRSLLQQAGGPLDEQQRQAIATRSQTLNRLLTPPTVVVAGPANVGKSTLTNALMGKAVSIVADLPGTTRDWVGGLVELGVGGWDSGNDRQAANLDIPNSQPLTPNSHVAVNWLDTPGLRVSDDTIEQRAIQLAKDQIEQADVLIAMRDLEQPWPDPDSLPRDPDLYVINKVDDASAVGSGPQGELPEAPLAISAALGLNLDILQARITGRLGLTDLSRQDVWAFSTMLSSWCQIPDVGAMKQYLV